MKNPISLFFLFLLAGVASCSSVQVGGNKGPVVAKVNDQIISEGQLRGRMNPRGISQIPAGEPESAGMKDKNQALNELIDEEVLIQQALKEGVLANSERLRREVMREYFQYKFPVGKEQPTEDEMKAFFESHKGELEKIQVRHILFRPKKPKDPASEEQARRKTEGILAQLRSQGKTPQFSKMARQFSDDETTKDKGGDLSFITQEKVVPAFWDAASKLEGSGAISNVVKTEFGYHIIQMSEDLRGFEPNRGSIRRHLATAKKKQLYDDLLRELRQKAAVKINDDVVASIQVAEAASTAK
ncbi:MAG TPA: peptidylprolyl isomerase [Bdellovibrionota bacterium]|nr:peptidylprolyl isomerase [Bdellovibrionota bacterium]